MMCSSLQYALSIPLYTYIYSCMHVYHLYAGEDVPQSVRSQGHRGSAGYGRDALSTRWGDDDYYPCLLYLMCYSMRLIDQIIHALLPNQSSIISPYMIDHIAL